MLNANYFINFKSNQVSSIPNKNNESNDYLLFSSCEGYFTAKGVFDEDGNFLYFCGWVAGEIKFFSPEDYDLWILLPSSSTLQVSNL
ncbi:hypothetical protein K1S64_18555 [Klebsiella pneumoniae]|uniref:hypothetical protein n=1 Tax=Klebsiella pneumoniae TaxID=573 RepID=UPI0004A027B5|nr:hypothetical protein [Klebsiella pneumoniae]HDS7992292.1 hypothetical protein [Klebsiella pneumoniae subsp. ozaenae]EIW8654253.1 hypothetical protein [Klebsiella pneumoniae]KDK63460.1 hypothetical protein AF22_02537 [Klebsiella pneumoniae CHS 66]MBC4349223.1 hypothetical protein [Klebsiella pneumoniae]MBC4416747.1 hypothetical protein [Klebsiella pneumoniae]